MHVVGAGQAPDLLSGDIGPAERRIAREIAPAIAMRVDRQIAEPAELDHSEQEHAERNEQEAQLDGYNTFLARSMHH